MAAAAHSLHLWSDLRTELASSLDYDDTLRTVVELAVPTFGDGCTLDILEEDGSLQRRAAAHVDPAKEVASRELARRYPPEPTADHGVPKVLRTGLAELVPEINDAQLVACARDAAHLALLRQFGAVSAIIMPLVAHGRSLGAATLVSADADRHYANDDLVQAKHYAAYAALAIDNARLYRIAQQQIRVRDTFLATVSHDLKNPLATITGQAQLLRRVARGDADARLIEGLRRIETVTARMAAMLDELLDVARLEQGQTLHLERGQLDLAALVHQKAAEHQVLTERHLFRIAGESELVGEWDAGRLERVLDNLLGNAIKYSPEGGVITVLVVREEDEEGTWAILSVRDQGMGIPAADLSRIFEQFQRAHNVAEIVGTGLGLSVSRQIVEQHGGSILVDSQEGEGSTFTVRLPLSTRQSS